MADNEKKTLEETDILAERSTSRRSTLAAIGASVLGAVALTTGATLATRANAQEETPLQTDNDSGPGADAAGRGRTGCTDSDSGAGADGAGHGRRCRRTVRRRGVTDNDSGQCEDRAGRGRGPVRACTDSDSGRCADGANRGRRC